MEYEPNNVARPRSHEAHIASEEIGDIVHLSRRQNRYFDLVKNVALQNSDKFKHAAVLVSGGKIINVAGNSKRGCSFGARFRKRGLGLASGHAELLSILNIERKNTQGADIYVGRVNAYGEWRNSLCCRMCYDSCLFVGINRVFYSTSDGKFRVIKIR